MDDTFERVSQNLVALLLDEQHKVIVLKGKWGTGKTYLWKKVSSKLNIPEKTSPKPIYVSLFGAKNISELKFRILQSAYLSDAPAVRNMLGIGVLDKVLNKYLGVTVQEAAMLWFPKLISNNLVVIDDIERKNNSLDIDELMGLFDEYSQEKNTRFLLLLNSDKLADHGIWKTLHEKVVDAEIVLDPSPDESFTVAAENYAGNFLEPAKRAVAILGISNIRIIRRILLNLDKISSLLKVGDENFFDRWVPSTVLLTAIHNHGILDGLTFDYIKNFNSFENIGARKDRILTQDELNWGVVLQKLGISYADQFEDVLQGYLLTGMLDSKEINFIFDRYRSETMKESVASQRDNFFMAAQWDPHKNNEELLVMARHILNLVGFFDAATVTNFVEICQDLGDPVLANSFLDTWFSIIELRPEYKNFNEDYFENGSQSIHPKIFEKMRLLKKENQSQLSPAEVIEKISKAASWGQRERLALSSSTVDSYVDSLKFLRGTELRIFLNEHFGWIRNGLPDKKFENGVNNFIDASIKICGYEPESRLSKIIHREFKRNGLEEKLSHRTPTEE